MAELPYQSLYRRYRPQRFSEVRGQDHVTLALRNSVRKGTVHHAYLFSGPRGTGKTSTARILAKALNCAAPVDGEPCCDCESCLAVAAGSSMDRVVKTTVFLVDLNDFGAMNEIYGDYFRESPPARSTVQVVRLPRGAAVEIEAVALAG